MGGAVGSKPVFPEVSPSEKKPFKIGRYSCTNKLGKGAFGSVYAAGSDAPGEVYAIKIQKVRSQPQVEIILGEINQHSSLDHPSIVKFYEAIQGIRYKSGAEQKVLCMVLEYVDGLSLERVISQMNDSKRILEGRLKSRWSWQILRGVEYLHSVGKIHRDLKPANLLISSATLDLKIADFGLSRDLDDGGMASTVCGTPLYMAPEIQPGKPFTLYGSNVDIWAMGVIFLELILDLKIDREFNKLITGPNYEYEITKKMNNTKVPQPLWELIARCTRLNPSERITAKTFLDSPVVRIYSLVYGLLSEDQAELIFHQILSSVESVVTILTMIGTSSDPGIKEWVLEEFCVNFDMIPSEALTHNLTTKIVASLVDRGVPQALRFQNLIKIKKRRSRASSPPAVAISTVAEVTRYPENKVVKTGWYWRALPTVDGIPTPRKFQQVKKSKSNILEKFYLSSVSDFSLIFDLPPPPLTLRGEEDSPETSPGAEDHTPFNFDIHRLSAKDLETERNFELRRYPPKVSKGAISDVVDDTFRENRIFQHLYSSEVNKSSSEDEEWIDFEENHQKVLRLAYTSPEVLAVLLNKGEKAQYLINFKNLTCYMISGNGEVVPIRYVIN